MDKSKLVHLLSQLNNGDFSDCEDLEELFKRKYEETLQNITTNYDDVLEKISPIITLYDSDKNTFEWKYICLNFYILELLNDELSKSPLDVLSVQEIKSVKSSLKILLLIGIFKNLQPHLPHFVKMSNYHETDVVYVYNLLKCTTSGLTSCIQQPNLRLLILPHLLQGILVALCQIAFCPLKKPTKDVTPDKFFMSEAMYDKFLQDQQLFRDLLEKIRQSIHPAIFIKETMVLFQSNSPAWFKKAISNILTKMIKSSKGVENIALAMLDGCEDDTTKTWKILDILTKLITSCRKFPDFRENIFAQLLNLLGTDLLIFERLIVSCTKVLYSEDKDLCTILLNRIMTPLLNFAYKEYKFRESDDVTDDIKQSIRLIYGCFVDYSANSPCLPMELLKSIINVVFHFYHLTVNSSFQTTNKELKELLIKYLHSCSTDKIRQLFDNFLFGFAVAHVFQFRNDVIVEIGERIVVKHSEHTVIYETAEVADIIFNLLEINQKIVLFGYLLNCITQKAKYFPTSSSKELLTVEESTCGVVERLLTVHRLLSQLAESQEVQQSLKDKPENIIKYIKGALQSDSEDSQFVFVVVMILDNLVSNSSTDKLDKFQILIEPLSMVALKSSNVELNNFCDKILTVIRERKVQGEKKAEVTEFDKALDDISDPLLPVRGHGLLVLAKLIEKKDKQAMERKLYLLNLFQLSLKNEDSFIYLNAVQGLAALGDVFPDTVLEVLCEEYADFPKNSENVLETRMKIGEVLVRVIKLLGEMASKYKALLLNTFLSGVKDDDHLMRASSLSNLGEVCRVLNYKLGTIVTEVLVCVHAVIATDKAVEARRAAVTVIRQLFVGLQSEMISFLKEDILPIYRTLKEIYYRDKDDVMRLQAQLALEELNENMKSFVFPNPQLSFEKKIVMLD